VNAESLPSVVVCARDMAEGSKTNKARVESRQEKRLRFFRKHRE
jgi:hypothetical protein